MKYLIAGTGAVGASIGAFLLNINKDVTFISRGKQLETLLDCGLTIKSDMIGNKTFKNIKAFNQDEFEEKADVIFVCVKSYSLDEIAPLVEKASHKNTIVIPILNTFENGKKLEKTAKTPIMFDGCIYIVCQMEDVATVEQTTNIFKIVFGQINNTPLPQNIMETILKDLRDAGIEVEFAEDINSAKFEKFSITSTFACCGAYYDLEAKDYQKDGEYRKILIEMLNEMKSLSKAMNLNIKKDITAESIAIIDRFNPTVTASMQRDLKTKGQDKSEIEGLLFDVVKLAEKYNVEMPHYKMIADKFRYSSANTAKI